MKEEIYRDLVQEYSNFDKHSTRFLFPPSYGEGETSRVVLLSSSYTHLSVKSTPGDSLTRDDSNMLYPDGSVLLLSFVQTLLQEPIEGMWTINLRVWAVSYICGETMLPDEALDTCDDEKAEVWFNKAIGRFGKGIDRVTCTRRLGRVGYDESLARVKYS